MPWYRCYDNSDVIATLIMTNFHLLWWQCFLMFVYVDVVYAKTWYDPEKLYRATFIRQYDLCCCNMALVSFRLFRKNLGHLREFFGQMVYRPPWQKISRTPMHVDACYAGYESVWLCDFHMVLTGMWSRGWTAVWPKYSVPAINIVACSAGVFLWARNLLAKVPCWNLPKRGGDGASQWKGEGGGEREEKTPARKHCEDEKHPLIRRAWPLFRKWVADNNKTTKQSLQSKEKHAGVYHCFYLDWVTMQFSTADEASL